MFRTLELTVAPGCHISAHYRSTPGIPAPVSRSRAAVANPCHSFRPAQLSPAGPSRSPPQRHSHHWHHRREQLIFFCRGSFDWATAKEKSLSARRGQHALNRTAGPKRFATNPPAKPPTPAPRRGSGPGGRRAGTSPGLGWPRPPAPRSPPTAKLRCCRRTKPGRGEPTAPSAGGRSTGAARPGGSH